MNILLAVVATIFFVEVVARSGFIPAASRLLSTSNRARHVVMAPGISDHWKEKALLAYSGRMMQGTLRLTLTLAAIGAGIWLLGLAAQRWLQIDLVDFLASWQGILLCTAIGTAYAWLVHRPARSAPRKAAKTGDQDYSATDKMLHRLALASPAVREMSFEIEMAAGGKSTVADTRERPHVFVAGLARAGTTILMRSLYASGQFRSLTYRDMPFVLMPNLWRKISGVGARDKALEERAHGDGIAVNYDSPEALEEVFWKTFAGDDYLLPDRLRPHAPAAEVLHKFRRYADAIIRSGDASRRRRYLSKNNNNILRLPALLQAFPGAQIIIPFRDPLQQALSLRNQHRRFVGDNEDDHFAGEYMGWLAHHEFGATRRPFCFDDGFVDEAAYLDPDGLDYWVDQWTHVYRHLLAGAAPRDAIFLSYERLCADDSDTWCELLKRLGLHDQWREGHDMTFTLSEKTPEAEPDSTRMRAARSVYQQLLARAL